MEVPCIRCKVEADLEARDGRLRSAGRRQAQGRRLPRREPEVAGLKALLAESLRRRRCVESVKEAQKPAELAPWGALGATGVADLPSLLAGVGWTFAMLAALLVILCFSESLLATVTLG